MTNNTVLPSKRRRKKARLITDREAIFEITGQWHPNPLPRCDLCKGVTVALTRNYGPGHTPRQREVARMCESCEIIFPKQTKTVVIETYDY